MQALVGRLRRAAGLGRAEDAVRLVAAFDAAVRTRVPHGHVPNATERHLCAHALAAIQAAGLSAAGHARAHAEGGGLSPQEATALAVRDTD